MWLIDYFPETAHPFMYYFLYTTYSRLLLWGVFQSNQKGFFLFLFNVFSALTHTRAHTQKHTHTRTSPPTLLETECPELKYVVHSEQLGH